MMTTRSSHRRPATLLVLVVAAVLGFARCGVAKTVSATMELTHDPAFVPEGSSGLAAAPAVLINGSLTGPTLRAVRGDTLRVTFINNMPEGTTVHFHGIWQKDNHYFMDGVPFVTQCPIPAYASFTYEFPLYQYGTYWYHSHVGWHRDLGLFGTLIVDPDPAVDKSVDAHSYDAEYVMQVSDWFADDPAKRFDRYRAGPCHRIVFVALLCNGKGKDVFRVRPGKTYRFRIIGAMANTMVKLSFEGHHVTVINADGWDVVHRTVNSFMIASGETYDVLVYARTKNVTASSSSFAVRAMIHPHKGCATDDASTLPMPMVDVATLEYEDVGGVPVGAGPDAPALDSDTLDTTTLRPHAEYEAPACECNLTINIVRDDSDARYIINQRLFAFPTVPLSMGGDEKETIVLSCRRGASVCMAINNQDFIHHPIHVHGHHFRVLGTGPGQYDPNTAALARLNRPHKHTNVVPQESWTVFHFMATNEGFWLVHCHMSFHVEAGLAWVLKIGEPVQAPAHVQALCGDEPAHSPPTKKKVILYDGNPAVVIALLVVVVVVTAWWMRKRHRDSSGGGGAADGLPRHVRIRQDDGL